MRIVTYAELPLLLKTLENLLNCFSFGC